MSFGPWIFRTESCCRQKLDTSVFKDIGADSLFIEFWIVHVVRIRSITIIWNLVFVWLDLSSQNCLKCSKTYEPWVATNYKFPIFIANKLFLKVKNAFESCSHNLYICQITNVLKCICFSEKLKPKNYWK